MAYLKIFPTKVTDKKALDYITNPDKTDEKLLVFILEFIECISSWFLSFGKPDKCKIPFT